MGTDQDWEKWGRDDPYFGVLSADDYRSGNLTEANRTAFFGSGEAHVQGLLDRIRARFEPGFRPGASLDFGCGVGRLLIPLARASQRATGVDISPSMLEESRANCARLGIDNVDLARSDDRLSAVQGEYDLVHSHIVFAHIAPSRGHALIEQLARKVRPRGFLAVQVLYACNAPPVVRALAKLRYRFPPFNALRNLLRGRPPGEPAMQLHVYDLPLLLRTLNRLGFGEALLVPDRFDNGTFDTVVVLAQRSSHAN